MNILKKGLSMFLISGSILSGGILSHASIKEDSKGTLYGASFYPMNNFYILNRENQNPEYIQYEDEINSYYSSDSKKEGPKTTYLDNHYEVTGTFSSGAIDWENVFERLGKDSQFEVRLHYYNLAPNAYEDALTGFNCKDQKVLLNSEFPPPTWIQDANMFIGKQVDKDYTITSTLVAPMTGKSHNDENWDAFGTEGFRTFSLKCSIPQDSFDDLMKRDSNGETKASKYPISIGSGSFNYNMKAITEGSLELKDSPFLGVEFIQNGKVVYRDVIAKYNVPKNDKEYLLNFKNELDLDDIKNSYFDEFTKLLYPPTAGDQDIKANVLNGGVSGGIISPDLLNGLSVEDVDFGTLKIGQVIPNQDKTNMISVRDWTGGNGWKLTAQHKKADRNQSLQLGVQVDEGQQVNLNDEPKLILTGDSQLETTTKDGSYTAKWGTHPTVGEFNNVIEWNLSTNVAE